MMLSVLSYLHSFNRSFTSNAPLKKNPRIGKKNKCKKKPNPEKKNGDRDSYKQQKKSM
jgi:hypothetical protein